MADDIPNVRTSATGVVKEKKTRSPAKPRKAYLAYKIVGDDLAIVAVTRKAEELLAVVDGDRDVKYQSIEL